jgi:PPP family 3-phenylpropionic acid transporter
MLWAVATAGELALMMAFGRWRGQVSARHLLVVAAVFSAIRWTGLALHPPLSVLVLLQLAHMVTFGLAYLALVDFITTWTGETIAAQAQGFMSMLRQGTAALALIGFGFLAQRFGATAYFGATAISLLGLALLLVSLRLMPPKRLAASNPTPSLVPDHGPARPNIEGRS